MLRIVSFVILPLFTIVLSMQESVFESNISVISSNPTYTNAFLIWTCLVVVYFYTLLSKIVSRSHFRFTTLYRCLLTTSSVLFLLTAGTPYTPAKDQMKAQLHVVYAFSATVCMLLSLLFIILELYHNHPSQYRLHLISILSLGIGSLLLFLTMGLVSGLLEIIVTLGATWLTYSLWIRSNQSLPQ